MFRFSLPIGTLLGREVVAKQLYTIKSQMQMQQMIFCHFFYLAQGAKVEQRLQFHREKKFS